MKIILLFILVLPQLLVCQVNDQWDIVGEMRYPVAGAEAVCPDGVNIYLFGGYSDSTQTDVDWIQKYNTTTGIWKFSSYNMNVSRKGFVASIGGDSAYIFGGGEDSSSLSQSIESWGFSGIPAIIDYDSNFSRINATGLIINDIYYVFGGNSYLNRYTLPYIMEYDIRNHSFESWGDTLFGGSNLPEQQMSANIGNDIFVFGGIVNGVSRKVYSFNINANIFTSLNVSLAIPRAAGQAVTFSPRDQIFIIGGYNEHNYALNTVEILSQVAGVYTIEEGPTLNNARYDFAAVEVNGYIYVLGGYNELGSVVNTVERLSPTALDVKEIPIAQAGFELYQNYPNPFNPATIIRFSLKNESFVSLDIYSVEGRFVKNLIKGDLSKGDYRLSWNGMNQKNIKVSSGVYLYRLTSNGSIATKKMLLLK
jgi:Kelch motif/FlgD Ig-like domain